MMDFFGFRFWFLIPSLFISSLGHAEHFPCSATSNLPPFHLSATESCRASIEISNVKICLPKELWREWLNSSNAPKICGELKGRWKLSAALAEEPLSHPKEGHTVFRLESLPFHDGLRSNSVPEFWKWIQIKREALSQRLAPLDPWCIYRSMTLAEHDSSSPLDFLRLIGFFHLFNASGVHLYALAIFVSWILGSLFLAAQVPSQSAIFMTRFLTVLAWLWAWILCGCRVGMLRPGLIVGVKLASRSLGFRWRYWIPFVLSFILELCLSLAYGKSFFDLARLEVALSVGGFLMTAESRGHPLYALLGGWIFVALTQAYHSGLVSLLAPALAVLTSPIFCGLTYPWILMESLLPTGTPVGTFLIKKSLWLLHGLVEFSLKTPSLWLVSKETLLLSLVLGVFWIGFSFLFSFRRRLVLFYFVLVFSLGFRFCFQSFGRASDFNGKASDVIQLDVGQGDSALVLGVRTGLIDAGSARSLSDSQWLHVLARDKVARLEWIGLTHLDEDHRGGIDRLVRLIPIRCIATSSQEVQSERGQALARKLLFRGIRLEAWENGCVPYPVFKPKDHPQGPKANGNQLMSAVLIPLKSGDTYLSAGDAEGEDEIPILRWADQLSSRSGRRVFKLSHHGSKTSSDPRALRLFHPDIAIISVGLGNRYGHPSLEVLERVSQMKIPIYRTDQSGPFRAEAFLRQPPEHLQ